MEQEKTAYRYRLAISVVGVLALLGGSIWFFTHSTAPVTPSLEFGTTTPIASSTGGGISATGSYTVAKDETIDLPTPPDFRAAVSCATSVSTDVCDIIKGRVKSLQAKLTADSYDLGAWINLGTLRKMAGDYRGAETAWVFIVKAAPKNTIAYADLADLYMNFLKDYPKADAMYRQVIALEPAAEDAYLSLAMLYGNFYTSGGSPETILEKGIVANPKSIPLEMALARYYASHGSNADAKTVYQKAIDIAQASGNTGLVVQIKAEAGI